ncbi:MAG TPA: thioredoxin fold domain-containing protein [Candidatus Kapabacteria bacterium]
MISKKIGFGLIAIALISAMAISASAEVHFQNLSFEDAKALAVKEHKTVMIDFYTTWCGWCKTLDKNTYTDESVSKLAAEKFIALKIDAEKGEGIALSKQYKVTGYPTILFFDKKGNMIERIGGYQPPGQFLRSMQTAAAGGSKALLDEIESAHPPKDASKWITAAYSYAQNNQRDKALGAFRKVLELDPENKQGGYAEAMYAVGFLSTGDEQWKTLSDAIQKFPDEADADQANMMIVRHDFEISDTAAAGHRIDAWAMTHPRDGASFNFFAWTAAQHHALLAVADDYSQRAVNLSKSPSEKAAAMNTRAIVVFQLGKAGDASTTEAEALKLVDPKKDQKLFAEITSEKAKFDKAMAEANGK